MDHARKVRFSRTCQTVPEEARDTDHELTGFVRTGEVMPTIACS